MEPQETITNVTFNGISQPDPVPTFGDIGPSRISGTSQFTNSSGQFKDAPYGFCFNGSYSSYKFTQKIQVLMNGTPFGLLRTNAVTVTSSAATHGKSRTDLTLSRPDRMGTMKLLSQLMLVVLSCVLASAKDTLPCDPYSIDAVQRILSSPTAMASGFGEKEMSRLGDRAAIALVKIFSKEDLATPSTVRRILPIIKAAFEQPKIITYEKDRAPDFTIILLRHLSDNIRDPKLRQAIDQTTQYVNQKTAEAANAAPDSGNSDGSMAAPLLGHFDGTVPRRECRLRWKLLPLPLPVLSRFSVRHHHTGARPSDRWPAAAPACSDESATDEDPSPLLTASRCAGIFLPVATSESAPHLAGHASVVVNHSRESSPHRPPTSRAQPS